MPPALSLNEGVLGDLASPALIAVSGGRDSVALLHALSQRGFTQLLVVHWDHGWRAESREDAAWVARLAQAQGFQCVAERSPAPTRTEGQARGERYAFFAHVAETRGIHRLFLAHHADDQVETFLLQLLRGAGGPGLGGMQSLVERDGLELIRPLLGCWRREIDAYIAAHGLKFREDSTNADPAHTRNRLRHETLPALAEVWGRPVGQSLLRAAAILAAENEYWRDLPELGGLGAELPVAPLRAMPLALQRRQVHAWLQQNGVSDYGFQEIEAVLNLINQEAIAKINLPRNQHVRRQAGRLFIEAGMVNPAPPQP